VLTAEPTVRETPVLTRQAGWNEQNEELPRRARRVVDAQRSGGALPTHAAEACGIATARAGTAAAGIARVKRIVLAAVVAVSLLSTSVVHARERRWSLFGGGLALFIAGWALDVGLTYGLGHQPAATSLIPVAGPLVQMSDSWAMIAPARTGNAQVDLVAQQRIDDANRTIQQVAYAVLALDCAMQLAGSTMLVVGVVGQDDHRADRVSVSVAPWSNGVRVRVRF
jgi:hypothetical protein